MIDFVALPLVGVLAAALVAGPHLAGLRPHVAARASTALLFSVLVAVVPTLWVVGFSGIAHTSLRNPLVDWSHHVLPDHQPAGSIVGVGFLAVAVVGTVRAGRVLRLHRKLRCTDTCPIEFVDSDDVFAYTIPGPAGTIAVSTGLRRYLDHEELALVIEHERTHARHRHDRYKLLGMLAVAFVPPIRSIAQGLDHQLERWADEAALVRTGGDRRVAARTVAKVALAAPSPSGTLGIADHGAAARADALLEPVEQPSATTRLRIASLVVAALALAIYQLHHSALFVAHLFR